MQPIVRNCYYEIVSCLAGSFQIGRNITVFTCTTYTARVILIITSCLVQVPVLFSYHSCRYVFFLKCMPRALFFIIMFYHVTQSIKIFCVQSQWAQLNLKSEAVWRLVLTKPFFFPKAASLSSFLSVI